MNSHCENVNQILLQMQLSYQTEIASNFWIFGWAIPEASELKARVEKHIVQAMQARRRNGETDIEQK